MLQMTTNKSFLSKHGEQIFALTMVLIFTAGIVLMENSSGDTYDLLSKFVLPFLILSIPFFLTDKSKVHISAYVFYKLFGVLLAAFSIHTGVGVFVESLRIF